MTGFDLATLRVDKEKEVDGVWMEMGDGCRLLIARANNPKYKQRAKRLQSRVLTRISVDPDSDERVVRECVAHHCLLGWEKLYLDKKEVGPYTPELALDLFEQFPDFLLFVLSYAQEREAYRTEKLEEAKGNSNGSSSGS